MVLALLATFAAFALVAGAFAAWSARLWRPAFPVVIAHALLGLGLVFHLTWIAFWVHPMVGRTVALLVLALAVASLGYLRAWWQWRHWVPSTTLLASLALMHLGFTFLWGGVQGTYGWVAIRYLCGPPPVEGGCGPMPSDNVLPAVFADRLWNDLGTTALLGDWNGSDRPPLQSGAILLGRTVAGLFGIPDTAVGLDVPNTYWTFAASVLPQFLALLAVVALVRALGLSGRAALVTAIFVSVLPLSVFNLVFTWPKMLSAAYGVAAAAVLVEAIRQRSRPAVPLVTAASLAALSTLAHGGGAFALPLFGGLALALLLTQRSSQRSVVRGWVLPAVAAAGAVVLVMAPWSAYTTWADPGHSRLIKLHLAGYGGVLDDRSFLAVLREAYAALSLREVVDIRVANLRTLIDPQLSTYGARDTPDWLLAWRLRDFSRPIATLCLGSALAAGFVVLTVIRLPRTRREGPRGQWWSAAWLMWLCLLSIVCWIAAIFGLDGAVVHTGCFTWLLILAAVPFAFLADKGRWGAVAAVLVLLAQTVYTSCVHWSMAAHVVPPLPTPPPPQVMATSMLGATVLGALGVVAAVVVEWRIGRRLEVVPQP